MSSPSARVDQLRLDRDRFVAFSFASADVLLELDSEHRIRYAAGATRALFDREAKDLLGTDFQDAIARDDRDRLWAAITSIPPGSRMPMISVRLGEGTLPTVVVTGYYMPDGEDRYYLALSYNKRPLSTTPRPSKGRDSETGLFDKEEFGSLVNERIETAKEAGENYELTLFDLTEFEGLRKRVDRRLAQNFVTHVSDTLRANSVDGDSAGRFDDDTYGVLHDDSLDVAALRAQIAEVSRHIDPEGAGLEIRAATVGLDSDSTSPEDTAKAVVYTINKFSEEQGDDFTIKNLSEGCQSMVQETVSQITEFKSIISDGKFNVALQPIVDLESGHIHHYEALARFDKKGERSPFELISFAEEVGVISEFDFVMVKRVIDMLDHARKQGKDLNLAVNLSGRSLSSPAFIESLLTLLRGHSSLRDRLWFEITESAKVTDLETTNNLIQNLRNAGYAVCLDDFGAGAAAFQYLRALKVDLVKIDGIYVREALTTTNGKAFLKAMASLCGDLGIDVVAEMIEDEKTAAFIRECGVQFGQGYLFGKPTLAVDPSARKISATPKRSRRASPVLKRHVIVR